MSYMRMSHTGAPLKVRSCRLDATLSSSSRLEAVSVERTLGGLCSRVPRGGVAGLPRSELPLPLPPPPHAASSSATLNNSDDRVIGRISGVRPRIGLHRDRKSTRL